MQQVKKVPKFSCRLCGAKQSVQQVSFLSYFGQAVLRCTFDRYCKHGWHQIGCQWYTLKGVTALIKQVYAISGKAADVRGVVTELNSKRQQQEEARDQALINCLNNDGDLHDEQQRDTVQPATAWIDYLEEVSTHCKAPALLAL